MKTLKPFLGALAALFSLILSCSQESAPAPRTPDLTGYREPKAVPQDAVPEKIQVPVLQAGSLEEFLGLEGYLEPLPEEQENEKIRLEGRKFRGGQELSLPKKYLEVPLDFRTLKIPPGGKTGKFAVVGSRQAVLREIPKGLEAASPGEYPTITPETLGALKVLRPVPLGTPVEILGRVSNTEGEYDRMFSFEDNLNYFYITEVEGKRGLIYGADLTSFESTAEKASRISYYYTKAPQAPDFLPLDGLTTLAPEVQAGLKKDYLAFTPAPPYRLSVERPDDMVAVYQEAFKDRASSVYFTTDLYVHSLHLLFNRMLSEVEEQRFIPVLKSLIQDFLTKVEERIQQDDGSVEEYTQTLLRTRNYFLIAKALIAMAAIPDTSGDAWDRPAEEDLMEADPQGLLAILPPTVKEELEMILGAEGTGISPNFLYEEDYTQYRPRGHYNKNPRLKAYFRTMMFLGRMHMYLDFSTVAAATQTMVLGPVALVANQVYFSDGVIQQKWRSLFDPITWLIGQSDDITFLDMDPVLEGARQGDLKTWFAEGKMEAELRRLAKNLRGPKIQGNFTYGVPSGAEDSAEGDLFGGPPKGWRLFGQRFVLDSSWTDRLTGGGFLDKTVDRPSARLMPKGLDIAAALGSKAAYSLLQDDRDRYQGYAPELDRIIKENNPRNLKEWGSTFYNRYLDLTGRIMTFEKGSGLYYSRTDLWDKRVLQSGLAAWAELRHDTILYVKQSYSELSGGGDWEPTFRTEPFPRPLHLVEPNLPFFYSLMELLDEGIPLLEKYKFLTPGFLPKFEAFHALVNRTAAIAEAQAQDRAISEEDNDWLVTVPSVLAGIVVPPMGNYLNDTDQLKMAMIADVHTGDSGVLEVGVGIPWQVYLAVNDGFGGRRIAKGYVLSYYEFTSGTRLTDEEWKAFIYATPSRKELEERRPGWLRGFLP